MKRSTKYDLFQVYHDGAFTKKEIIQRILALVENVDFWPCFYTTGSRSDEFFVHNSFDALDVLFRNQLTIGNVGSEKLLKIELRMNVAQFQPGHVDVIAKIQKLCLDSFINKILFLDNIQEKPIFRNVVIDMTAPRVVSQILLWASRKCGTTCTAISMNNNGITSCMGMFPLLWFPSLKHLSLANNKIDDFDKLNGIPQANKITSVALDGNAICNVSMFEYIKGLKRVFTSLETLDGMPVGDETFMLSRQNFLSHPEAYSLVEAFITRYFKIYDSNTRHLLKELYANQALFTVSCQWSTQKNSARIQNYVTRQRNLARMVNLKLTDKNVFVGPQEIYKAITEMHFTEHDYHSFHIDLVHYNKSQFLVVVSGIFKDIASNFLDEELLLDFRRTFLVKVCNKEMGLSNQSYHYKIHNDMLTVRNVLVKQKQYAFKVEPTEKEVVNPEHNEENERNALLVVFQELTQLNTSWCTRFLEESKWNFKIALNTCVKMMEDGKIPPGAFEVR